MNASVSGSVHLGCIVIETHRFADWRRFGTDVMRFRLDDQECRFLLRRVPAEDVGAAGWHIDDHATFEQIEPAYGPAVGRRQRRGSATPGLERMLASGWVTGDSGIGHLAITSAEAALPSGAFQKYSGIDGVGGVTTSSSRVWFSPRGTR